MSGLKDQPAEPGKAELEARLAELETLYKTDASEEVLRSIQAIRENLAAV